MAKDKKYDDDDGRTIADMSDISRTPMMFPDFVHLNKKKNEENSETDSIDAQREYNMNKTERGAYISGAVAAALAIGSVFAVVIGIAIFIMTRIWS